MEHWTPQAPYNPPISHNLRVYHRAISQTYLLTKKVLPSLSLMYGIGVFAYLLEFSPKDEGIGAGI